MIQHGSFLHCVVGQATESLVVGPKYEGKFVVPA